LVTGRARVLERAGEETGSARQPAGGTRRSTPAADYIARLLGVDLVDDPITSGAELIEDATPPERFTLEDVPESAWCPAAGPGRQKCERCWQVLGEVGRGPAPSRLCLR